MKKQSTGAGATLMKTKSRGSGAMFFKQKSARFGAVTILQPWNHPYCSGAHRRSRV